MKGIIALLTNILIVKHPNIMTHGAKLILQCVALQDRTVVAGKMVGNDSNFHLIIPNQIIL